MSFTKSDIASLASKLETLTEGERAALKAVLLPDDEVQGFGRNELGMIRDFINWEHVVAAPVKDDTIVDISNGDLGSGRYSTPGDVGH